ncbi:MAG: hypothetical protein K0S47_4427 [Herbinix sp.]|nr:hypothetical protein [Herbinix sp.]
MKTGKVFVLIITMILMFSSCSKHKASVDEKEGATETMVEAAGDDTKNAETENSFYQINSLSNTLQMSIYQNDDNQLCYTVSKADDKGKFIPWIKESQFHINIDSVNYFANSTVTDVKTETTDREYALLGNQSIIRDHGITSTYTLEQEGYTYYLEVRVYDDGVAFRYRLPSVVIPRRRLRIKS